MAEDSLKNKTIKGTAWSAIDNVSQYGVTFIVGIVLARLLSPDDYGLIGIVGIFTAICKAVIDGGFTTALIREKDVEDIDYSTAFITNLCLSLFLYLIIFFCSPLIAKFFGRAELIQLTRVSSIVLIIGAFAIIQQTKLTKAINFKAQTKITIIAVTTSGIVGIAMAFFGCGVWSLVMQSLILQLLRTILLWIVNHWTPSLRFSKKSFKKLFGFGWKMMASQVLDSAWKQLYQVVVGKFYSPATLGQYTRAKGFSELFSSNLTSVIQRVTYPVLSNIQSEKERMVSAYRRIIKITMFVTFICMFGLAAISTPLIYCLIGEKWLEAARYLPLICIAGSLYPLHAINLNMLQVQGRSDLFLLLEIIKKIIGLIPLFVGAFVGIIPMLLVNLVIGLLNFFLNSHWTGKLLGYSSWAQIRDVLPSFVIATIMAAFVFFIGKAHLSYWIILPIQIIVGISFVLLYCERSHYTEYEELKAMALSVIKKSN